MSRGQCRTWIVSLGMLILAAVAGCSKKVSGSTPTTTAAPGSALETGGGMGAGSGSCLACEMRAANAGKTCPNTSKTSFLGTTDPAKFGCSGFPPADQAKCTALLACLRTKRCAHGFDPIPCLCGNLDAPTCAQKAVKDLPGACRDLYASAANGGDVYTLFFSTDSAIGVANNLFACDVDARCSCP